MEEKRSKKWKGETIVELKNTTPTQIWPLIISNFCTIHKWTPHIKTCYLLQGVLGQPGMVRYCSSSSSSDDFSLDVDTLWATERLLMIDDSNMCFSYEVVDNNVGFKTYIATIRLEGINHGGVVGGCRVVWSFVADPVEGFTFQGFVGFIESIAKVMASKMEQECARVDVV